MCDVGRLVSKFMTLGFLASKLSWSSTSISSSSSSSSSFSAVEGHREGKQTREHERMLTPSGLRPSRGHGPSPVRAWRAGSGPAPARRSLQAVRRPQGRGLAQARPLTAALGHGPVLGKLRGHRKPRSCPPHATSRAGVAAEEWAGSRPPKSLPAPGPTREASLLPALRLELSRALCPLCPRD